nr:site-specific integrase [Actinomycetota bacterium]
MASIVKQENGRYKVRYRTPDGKDRAKRFDRKRDAQTFANTLEADKIRGTFTDPREAATPFSKVADQVMAGKLNLRPATRARDESLIRCHVLPAFGRVAVGRITRPQVQAWVSDLHEGGLAARTVRECYRILSGIMSEAVLSKIIPQSPCQKIALPRADHTERRFLSSDEVERLAGTFERDEALVYSAVYLGCRWEELAGLKREHLEPLRRQVRIVGTIERAGGTYNYVNLTKSEAGRRTLRVPGFLVEILAAHLARAPKSEWVFPAPEGGFLRYDNFRRRVWGPTVAGAGFEGLTFHELRHTATAIMVDQGADLLQVMRRLGHKDIRTTLQLYGHLFPNREDDLNDRLEAVFRAARVSNACPTDVVGLLASEAT